MKSAMQEHSTLAMRYEPTRYHSFQNIELAYSSFSPYQTLTKLYLDWNEIGATGAQHIAEALHTNTVLFLSYSWQLHIHLFLLFRHSLHSISGGMKSVI